MSSVVGGPSEVETFLSRLIDGQFEIDTAHPNAKAFQSALNTYRVYKRASVVPNTSKRGRHKGVRFMLQYRRESSAKKRRPR